LVDIAGGWTAWLCFDRSAGRINRPATAIVP